MQKSGVRCSAGGGREGARIETPRGLCGDSNASYGRGCDQYEMQWGMLYLGLTVDELSGENAETFKEWIEPITTHRLNEKGLESRSASWF